MTTKAITPWRGLLQATKPGAVVALGPPASRADLEQYVIVMLANIKSAPSTIPDPNAFMIAQRDALASRGYSAAVLRAAYERALTTEEWLPATATMIRVCDEIERKQRKQKAEAAAEAERQRSEARKAQWEDDERAKGIAEIERKLGKKIRPGEIAKTWDAIEAVLGLHARDRWHAAVMKGESWALRAAKFMTTVDPAMKRYGEEYLKVYDRWRELRNGT